MRSSSRVLVGSEILDLVRGQGHRIRVRRALSVRDVSVLDEGRGVLRWVLLPFLLLFLSFFPIFISGFWVSSLFFPFPSLVLGFGFLGFFPSPLYLRQFVGKIKEAWIPSSVFGSDTRSAGCADGSGTVGAIAGGASRDSRDNFFEFLQLYK